MDPKNRRLPLTTARQTPRAQRAAGSGPEPPVHSALEPDPSPGIDPGSVIGDFEVIRELGRSESGLVLEARQRSRERLVALKVLTPNLSALPARAARFEEEAALAARVINPGIVPILAQGISGGYRYYAMALAAGPTLARFIEEAVGTRGEAFFHDAALRFAGLARSVDALHRAGIIHRKIQPSSIFLEGERLLLADFEMALDLSGSAEAAPGGAGIASAAGDDSSAPQAASRKGRHAAPEEFLVGGRLDRRADIYSLGMSLYELATGILPFPICSEEELARLKLTRRPIAPRRLNGDVPLGLEAVIRQATEANPLLRHATGEELARDLERFAERKRGPTRRHGPAPQSGEDETGEDTQELVQLA
jgi:serine/threonine protein kinase